MIVLDTTVLVYAVGTEHALREPCRTVLEIQGHRTEAATTVEVIQEFVHVRGRRRPRQDAASLGREYARALTLLSVGPDDLELGLDLYEQHSNLGSFDALLAAVAIARRAKFLVSADAAFGSVNELPWADPRSPELAAYIQSLR